MTASPSVIKTAQAGTADPSQVNSDPHLLCSLPQEKQVRAVLMQQPFLSGAARSCIQW